MSVTVNPVYVVFVGKYFLSMLLDSSLTINYLISKFIFSIMLNNNFIVNTYYSKRFLIFRWNVLITLNGTYLRKTPYHL